jgi:hypothetical protein
LRPKSAEQSGFNFCDIEEDSSKGPSSPSLRVIMPRPPRRNKDHAGPTKPDAAEDTKKVGAPQKAALTDEEEHPCIRKCMEVDVRSERVVRNSTQQHSINTITAEWDNDAKVNGNTPTAHVTPKVPQGQQAATKVQVTGKRCYSAISSTAEMDSPVWAFADVRHKAAESETQMMIQLAERRLAMLQREHDAEMSFRQQELEDWTEIERIKLDLQRRFFDLEKHRLRVHEMRIQLELERLIHMGSAAAQAMPHVYPEEHGME